MRQMPLLCEDEQAIAAGEERHIDTSDYYGPHVTNQIIKKAASSGNLKDRTR